MLAKRIIPCLDITDGRVVKGVRFRDLRDIDDPVSLARIYNEEGADELVFYDITASVQGRSLFTDLLSNVASQLFIPLTVGGGIRDLLDFERVLRCGADKVSVNTGAIDNRDLIHSAAQKYGSQCVVLSMDVSLVDGSYHVFRNAGATDTGMDALQWAVWGQQQGAGELVINSIDADGVKGGFDLPLLRAIAKLVQIPIIASGGAGSMQDFAELFEIEGVDAGLAASVFHLREIQIPALKDYLRAQGITVRT